MKVCSLYQIKFDCVLDQRSASLLYKMFAIRTIDRPGITWFFMAGIFRCCWRLTCEIFVLADAQLWMAKVTIVSKSLGINKILLENNSDSISIFWFLIHTFCFYHINRQKKAPNGFVQLLTFFQMINNVDSTSMFWFPNSNFVWSGFSSSCNFHVNPV